MSATYIPEPAPVAEMVEQYVCAELNFALKYDNREPLDGSGVYSLHALAAQIYALGHRDAHVMASMGTRSEQLRREIEAKREVTP